MLLNSRDSGEWHKHCLRPRETSRPRGGRVANRSRHLPLAPRCTGRQPDCPLLRLHPRVGFSLPLLSDFAKAFPSLLFTPLQLGIHLYGSQAISVTHGSVFISREWWIIGETVGLPRGRNLLCFPFPGDEYSARSINICWKDGWVDGYICVCIFCCCR